jgi:hypothetical protein
MIRHIQPITISGRKAGTMQRVDNTRAGAKVLA